MSNLSNKVQEVFNEPGCATNQGKPEKERKKGCTKQLQPGAAAGGCAFDGAKIALQPITDVAHLVHGPIACEGNSCCLLYTSQIPSAPTGQESDALRRRIAPAPRHRGV